MAHEINNPLSAITNLIFIAKEDAGLPAHLRKLLCTADEELSRVREITRKNLSFFRGNNSPTRFNLKTLVEDVLSLYQHRFEKHKIEVEREYRSDAEILAPEGEIRQVVGNLLSNAVEAMPQGGSLRIRVRNSTDRDKLGGVILMSDSGDGIRRENRRRIFESFFTTKGNTGTGLGLWLALDILGRHGGRLRFRTSTGKCHGTTFSIFLPEAPVRSS